MAHHPRPGSFWYALAAGGLIYVAVLSVPSFDGPHSRQYSNQSVAVSRLRAVVSLQRKFAAAHVDKGFTCSLPQLMPEETGQNSREYDSLHFLITGTRGGYKFVLDNCRSDASGVIVHYEATAVPVALGKTGFHAFCTDDAGLLLV